jgi:hypothetical protein
LQSLFGAAHLLLKSFVVMNGARSGDELIGEPVVDNDLAAAIAEPA